MVAVSAPIKATTADALTSLRAAGLRVAGTDVAMNSAQLTLVKGDLRGIAMARALSFATVANMKQNRLRLPPQRRAGASLRTCRLGLRSPADGSTGKP